MLSGLCEALAGDGGRLSLVARRASAWRAAPAQAFDCDDHDEASFAVALEVAVAANGPVDLAVTWIHTLKIVASRQVAARVVGRICQVDRARSRWLTDAEISEGVLEAIRADRPLSMVGQSAPWNAKP